VAGLVLARFDGRRELVSVEAVGGVEVVREEG
jgi:hypothetical protein